MQRVMLVPLSSCDWTSAFTNALSTINLDADVIADVAAAREAWPSGRFRALVVAGLPQPSMRHALEPLVEMSTPRVLAVLPRDTVCDVRWLHLVGDVVFWPAESPELQFRFGRLIGAASTDRTIEPALERMLHEAELVGVSEAFQNAFRKLPQIVRCAASVLVSGETGTGKDLVARAIHYLGARRGGPFVPVNCAALPESLFENELFGHVRGAYTTAAASQDGLVAQANGGTLFLDEVDTLAPRSQAALLRFLQDGYFRPLGAGAARASDVRIVAATNANLEALTAAGAFREDLFYRLNVLRIDLPPLRDRREDIALLATHMVNQLARRYRDGTVKRLSPTALAWLSAQHWPGNVRELENWVHRRYLLCTDGTIELEDLERIPPASAAAARFRTAKRQAIAEFERQYLSELIARTRGNVSEASRTAGAERRAFGRLLQKHRIDPARYRGNGRN
jgi:DNA-binding NtrC family response regulator